MEVGGHHLQKSSLLSHDLDIVLWHPAVVCVVVALGKSCVTREANPLATPPLSARARTRNHHDVHPKPQQDDKCQSPLTWRCPRGIIFDALLTASLPLT